MVGIEEATIIIAYTVTSSGEVSDRCTLSWNPLSMAFRRTWIVPTKRKRRKIAPGVNASVARPAVLVIMSLYGAPTAISKEPAIPTMKDLRVTPESIRLGISASSSCAAHLGPESRPAAIYIGPRSKSTPLRKNQRSVLFLLDRTPFRT